MIKTSAVLAALALLLAGCGKAEPKYEAVTYGEDCFQITKLTWDEAFENADRTALGIYCRTEALP